MSLKAAELQNNQRTSNYSTPDPHPLLSRPIPAHEAEELSEASFQKQSEGKAAKNQGWGARQWRQKTKTSGATRSYFSLRLIQKTVTSLQMNTYHKASQLREKLLLPTPTPPPFLPLEGKGPQGGRDQPAATWILE